MKPCLCGHAEFLHTNTGCLKWFLGCNCDAFVYDDGTDGDKAMPGPRHDSDPYAGIYRPPGGYKLGTVDFDHESETA